MGDNTRFEAQYHLARVVDFPDHSGGGDATAFPECRSSVQHREQLHHQLMRIIRNSSAEISSHRRQNDRLLSYQLSIHDLSLREATKQVSKLKKEQLHSRHMQGWITEEITTPMIVHEHDLARKKMRQKKAKQVNQQKTEQLHLPSINERNESFASPSPSLATTTLDVMTTPAPDNTATIPETNQEPSVEMVAPAVGPSAVKPSQRRVTLALPPEAVDEKHNSEYRRKLNTAPPTTKSDTKAVQKPRKQTLSLEDTAEKQKDNSSEDTTLTHEELLNGQKSVDMYELKFLGVKPTEKKAVRKKTFVERNFCANKDRLFTRYLNAKKTFERDFNEAMVVKPSRTAKNSTSALLPVRPRKNTMSIIKELKEQNTSDTS